jgi:hypothetical protein
VMRCIAVVWKNRSASGVPVAGYASQVMGNEFTDAMFGAG